MSKRYGLSGVALELEFSKAGLKFKSDGTVIKARDNADAAYVGVESADPGVAASNDNWASTRAFRERLGMTPERFGAVGDGTTDDAAALQAAITASVTAGVPLVLGPVTYKIESELDASGATVRGTQGKTRIDASGASSANFSTASAAVFAQGSLGGSLGTILAANKGARTLTVSTAAHGIVAGDSIIIYDPTDFSFSLSLASYRDGEVVTVLSVAGAVLTLANPVSADYAATTEVYKPTWSTADLYGFEVTGLSNTSQFAPLKLELCKNAKVERVHCTTSQAGVFTLAKCFDCDIVSCSGVNTSALAGLNYGVSVANSQSLRFTRCHYQAPRHAFTTGGANDAGSIVCRNIVVSDSHFEGDGTGGVGCVDTHGNAERVTFSNCFINGGMNLGGDFITVESCHVRSEPVAAIGIQIVDPVGYNYTITDCMVEATVDGSNLNVLMVMDGTASSPQGDGHMRISGCTFEMHDFDGSLMLLRKRTGSNDVSVSMTDCTFNQVTAYGDTDGQVKISGLASSGSYLRSVQVSNCRFDGCGLYVEDVREDVQVSDCIARNASQRGFSSINLGGVLATDSIGTPAVTFSDCRAVDCGSTGFYTDIVNNTAGLIQILNCQSLRNGRSSTGGAADLAGVTVLNAAAARINGCTFGDDQGVQTQIREMVVSGVGELYDFNNVHLTPEIAINTTAVTTQRGYTVTNARYAVTYVNSAPPTTGYWNVGSIAYNFAANLSGETVFWWCTVAGTPGTWVALITLP